MTMRKNYLSSTTPPLYTSALEILFRHFTVITTISIPPITVTASVAHEFLSRFRFARFFTRLIVFFLSNVLSCLLSSSVQATQEGSG